MPTRLLRNLSLALVVCLAPSLLGEGDDAAARLKATLDEGRAVATTLRDAIDPAEFDVDALAKQLGPSPEAAFWHVRAILGYAPYPGALRGAEGCLRSGGGNAVDRALLLAEVLKRNGHRVRFAFADVPAEAAETWVDAHLESSEGPSPLSFELPYFIDDETIAAGRAAKEEALCERLEARFTLLRDAIAGALGDRATAAKGAHAGVAVSQLVKEARAHVWVQVERDGAWVDLDPSPEGPPPGSRIVEPESTADAIPAERWHQVRLRGFAERFDGKRVSEEEVFDVSLPAADLAGRLVVVETLPAEGAGGVAAPADTGETRRLRLRVGDREAAVGVVEISRAAGGGAAGGLGGLVGGGKGKPGEVVALGVEVSSSFGSRRGEASKRYLLDRWGHAARTAKDVAPLAKRDGAAEALVQADATALAFAIEVGLISAPQLQRTVLENTIATFAALKVDGDRLTWTGREGDLAALVLAETYYHLVDRASAAWLPRRGFAAEPRIVLLRVGVAGGKAFLSIDVTQDHPRIASVEGEDTYRAEWERGLISAIAEESIVPPPQAGAVTERPTRGSAQALEDTLSRGPPTVIDADAPTLSPDADAWIGSALRKGRLVVLPEGQAADGHIGWFELDPKSGELLAWVESGLHEGTAERGILEKDTPQKTAVTNQYRSSVQDKFGCVAESVSALGFLAFTASQGGAPIEETMDLASALAECIHLAKKPYVDTKLPPTKVRIDDKARDHVKKRHKDRDKHEKKTKWGDGKDWEDYTRKTIDNPDRVYKQADGNFVYEKDFGTDIVGSKIDGSSASNKVRAIVKPDGGGNGGRVTTSFPEPSFNTNPD